MSIGFTPGHSEQFPLNDLLPAHFLVLAVDTALALKWEIGYISEAGIIAYTNDSREAEIKIILEEGFANIKSSLTGSELIDWGKNKKNISQFLSTLHTLRSTATDQELSERYNALQPHFAAPENDVLKQPPPTATEQVKGVLAYFVPRKDYFITPLLIDINIFLFLMMALSGVSILTPDNQSLLSWGANYKPMTLDGQWWRLITNCFLHIGIVHLLMNMYALVYIGILLEPILGRARFITAYLLTGITASLCSLWWHNNSVSAGASGAIFGMYGFFLALLTTSLIENNTRKELLKSIGIFVVLNLFVGLRGGTDNAAHIGGLLGGIVIGYAFIPSLKKPENNRLKFSTIGLVTLLVLVSSSIAYSSISNDMAIYYKEMKNFSAMEGMALEFYGKQAQMSKQQQLMELKERGYYYWTENKKLITRLDKLSLPQELHKRNEKLKKYCDLRLQVYNLMYLSIEQDTPEYQQQIDSYNQQIDSLLERFKNE